MLALSITLHCLINEGGLICMGIGEKCLENLINGGQNKLGGVNWGVRI